MTLFLERDGGRVKQVRESQHTCISFFTFFHISKKFYAFPYFDTFLVLLQAYAVLPGQPESTRKSCWKIPIPWKVSAFRTLQWTNIIPLRCFSLHPPSQPQQQGEACENANKAIRKESLFSDHVFGEVCSLNLSNFFLLYVLPCWNLEIIMCNHL